MMFSGNQERADAGRTAEVLGSQYQDLLSSWADVSKCCMEAADDIYQTSLEYVRDQAEQLREITRDPGAAMREQTYSRAINCSFDAADRIAQAYLHSLETVREPLMRAVSAQLPIGRAFSGVMEHGMQQGAEFVQRSGEQMEKTLRGAAERTQEAHQESNRHTAQSQSQQNQHGRSSQQGGRRRTA